MDSEPLDAILAKTLEDARMSRGERQVLRKLVEELGPGELPRANVRERAFALVRERLALTEQGALDWLADLVKVTIERDAAAPRYCKVFATPGDDCPRTIVNRLDSAEQTIDVCVFTITDDRISDALLDAFRRGVAVRVITDNDKAFDPGSDIDRLRGAGMSVRIDQTEFHMHHKFAVIDARWTLSGSYNWTRGAAMNNVENLLITDDPCIYEEYARIFERLWKSYE